MIVLINKQGFSKKDSRHMVLSNLRSITMSTAIFLNQISYVEEGKVDPNEFKKIFGLDYSYAPLLFGKMLPVYIGPACLTFFLFRIENYFKAILSQFDADIPDGFYETAQKLFRYVNIQKKENKLRVLFVASLIRNSLHTDGVYTKKNRTIKIGKTEFKFVKGESTLTINWNDLYSFSDKIIDIVEAINTSPEVSILKDPIPFKYTPKNP